MEGVPFPATDLDLKSDTADVEFGVQARTLPLPFIQHKMERHSIFFWHHLGLYFYFCCTYNPPAGPQWGTSSGTLGPRQSRSIPESAGLRKDYGRYFWYGRQHHLWDGCKDLVSGWGMLNTEPSGSTRVYIQALTEFSNTRAVNFSDHPWFLETRAPSTTPPQSAGPPGARSQERFEEPASWWGLQKAGPAARPAQHLAPPITRNPGSRALILCVYTVYDYLIAFSFVASHYYFYQHWNIYIKLDFKSYFGEMVPCK